MYVLTIVFLIWCYTFFALNWPGKKLLLYLTKVSYTNFWSSSYHNETFFIDIYNSNTL